MMRRDIAVPTVVRNKATVSGAGRWLDDLPDLVSTIEDEWSITVGRPLEGATEAFVAEARLGDGSPAVLKLIVPRSGEAARHEITALRIADGVGLVRLLRHDLDRGALLLERLGRSLHELALPTRRRHEILCATAAAVWQPAAGFGLTTGAEKGRWLVRFITSLWEQLDHPCSERAVEHALACAERRVAAHDDERSVLVHGDVHQWNALEAGGGFKLVDPDGLLAEAEYDMGIIMREDPAELLGSDARERSRWLARTTGLDETAIWEWGVVERLSTGLLATQIEFAPETARQMLAVADAIVT